MKYIYVLKGGDDYYKVGIAADVLQRVRDIQTSNPRRVQVVCARPVRNAGKLERSVHAYLAEQQMDGGTEWFDLTPEQVVDICVLIHQHPEAVYVKDLNSYAVLDENRRAYAELQAKLDTILVAAEGGRMETPQLPVVRAKDMALPVTKARQIVNDEEMLERAAEVFRAYGKASTSLLQRELRIGYGRASRYVERLTQDGIIGNSDRANGYRPILR